MLTPCDPSDPHAMAMNWRQMDSTKVLALPVLVQDYFDVLKKIKPLVAGLMSTAQRAQKCEGRQYISGKLKFGACFVHICLHARIYE